MTRAIFGFGSLLSTDSLKATAPGASNIRPAYIKGFIRDFNLWDSVGYNETNLDLAGIPFCALDVRKIADSEARVNGVIFEVNQPDFERLLAREREYKLLNTRAYDFESNNEVGECLVFSANKNNGSFVFDSEAQSRYLQIALEGAKQHGEAFYDEFLATTYIGDKRLSDIPGLVMG